LVLDVMDLTQFVLLLPAAYSIWCWPGLFEAQARVRLLLSLNSTIAFGRVLVYW
jgi:hypothetical protein